MKIKLQKINCREFIRYVSKIVQEWNDHLEIFGRPQVIENPIKATFASPNRYFTESRRWVPLTTEAGKLKT